MAGWDGSGNFTRAYNWVDEKDAGNNIDSTKFDAENDAFAAGIEACIAKNGENTATGDLPMGGNKHTGVGDGSALTHYSSVGQVQDGSVVWGGTSGGAANVQTITLAPAATEYTTGMVVTFVAGFTNTAETTININGIGAKNVFSSGAACIGGEIILGQPYTIVYDVTKFSILSDTQPDISFRAVPSIAQTISTGSFAEVTLGTESYDSGGNFAANTFTAPIDGVYNFSAGGTFGANATGARLIQLWKNGGTRVAQMVIPVNSVSSPTDMCVSCDIDLAATDTVAVRVFQDSGGNLNFGTTATFFSGHLVRRT